MMATSTLSTTDTSSLVSTNDNHRVHEEHRAGNTAATLAAVAAVGLTSAHEAAAETHHVAAGSQQLHANPIMSPQMLPDTHFTVREAAHDLGGQSGHAVADSHVMATTHLSSGAISANGHGLAGQNHGGHQAPTQLLAGTEGHVMSHGPVPVTSAGIAIPSAQQLAAHMGHGADKGAVDGLANSASGAQSNAVVGKVLADSLAGGHGHGPNIDVLLSHAAGHDHGNAKDALAALASHDTSGVSNGHSGVFAGFHNAPIMEHMAMQHDAMPAHS